jgi:L-fuculose-phosphate aldolase
LGNGLQTFGSDKLKDLIAIRKKLGMPDDRDELKECELCDNSEFRPGVVCSIPDSAGGSSSNGDGKSDPEAEAMVQQVTDMIMKQLKS